MTHEWRGPMPLLPACLYSIPHTHTSGTVLTAPLLRPVQALGRLSERWRTLLLLSLVLGHAVVGGALLMSAMEGWGFATSCYFCLVTMTTVGLGDMTPSSAPAKARKDSTPPQRAWACARSRNPPPPPPTACSGTVHCVWCCSHGARHWWPPRRGAGDH